MIFFKPVTDYETISQLYPDRQIETECAAIIAYDGDAESGKCLISVSSYNCLLSDISADAEDDLLVEGLIRSALNFAANRGAYTAECSENKYDKVLTALGFELNGALYSGEIPELLKGSCCKNS